ncbi:hypothetical protein [Bradyrhizobium diazoefficiens]
MSAILLKLDSLLRGPLRASPIAVAVALFAAFATPAHAQCVDRGERAPSAAISAFVSDPSVLLRQSKNDRDKLSGRLTGLLVTDIAALEPVRDMLREASQADRIAIGARASPCRGALRRDQTRRRAQDQRIRRQAARRLRAQGIFRGSGYGGRARFGEPCPIYSQ